MFYWFNNIRVAAKVGILAGVELAAVSRCRESAVSQLTLWQHLPASGGGETQARCSR